LSVVGWATWFPTDFMSGGQRFFVALSEVISSRIAVFAYKNTFAMNWFPS